MNICTYNSDVDANTSMIHIQSTTMDEIKKMMETTKQVNSINCSFDNYTLGVLCSREQASLVEDLGRENFDSVVLGYTYYSETVG